MHRLKKALVSLTTAALVLGAAPVHAQDFGKGMLGKVGKKSGFTQSENVTGDQLPNIIGGILQTLLGLLGAVFLVLMVYAGYLWMTARGDSKTVDKAKDIIRQSIMGIIIVTLAYAITGFVVSRLASATGETTPATAGGGDDGTVTP